MKRRESESDTAAEKPYTIPKTKEFDYMISQTVLPGDYKKFESRISWIPAWSTKVLLSKLLRGMMSRSSSRSLLRRIQ